MSVRSDLSQMTETAKASSRTCKRSTLDLARKIGPPRSHEKGSCIEKRCEQQKRGGGHTSLSRTEIQTLQDENKALKDENRALKDENEVLKNESREFKRELRTLKAKHAKKYDCPLCKCSYSRSDRLYEHLRKGNSEHQAHAQNLQRNTRCERCAKDFGTWTGLQQHISRSRRHIAETTEDVVYSEPDGSRYLIAALVALPSFETRRY